MSGIIDQALSLSDGTTGTESWGLQIEMKGKKLERDVVYPRKETQNTTPVIYLQSPSSSATPQKDNTSDDKYIIVSIDISAPYPSNSFLSPILHWISANATIDQTTSKLSLDTNSNTSWINPNPPPLSSPHKYLFMIFEQPEEFDIERFRKENITNMAIWSRMRWDLEKFVVDYKLGKVIASNYFMAS